MLAMSEGKNMNEDIPVQLEPLLRSTLEHRHRQRSSGCREPWSMEGLRVAKGCAVASLPTAARGSGFWKLGTLEVEKQICGR